MTEKKGKNTRVFIKYTLVFISVTIGLLLVATIINRVTNRGAAERELVGSRLTYYTKKIDEITSNPLQFENAEQKVRELRKAASKEFFAPINNKLTTADIKKISNCIDNESVNWIEVTQQLDRIYFKVSHETLTSEYIEDVLEQIGSIMFSMEQLFKDKEVIIIGYTEFESTVQMYRADMDFTAKTINIVGNELLSKIITELQLSNNRLSNYEIDTAAPPLTVKLNKKFQWEEILQCETIYPLVINEILGDKQEFYSTEDITIKEYEYAYKNQNLEEFYASIITSKDIIFLNKISSKLNTDVEILELFKFLDAVSVASENCVGYATSCVNYFSNGTD